MDGGHLLLTKFLHRVGAFVKSVKASLPLLEEMVGMPAITLAMAGDSECRQLYRHCSRRHPRIPFVKNKQVGVALLHVPDCLEDFLKGGSRKAVRTARNRSTSRGYVFRLVTPSAHFNEVMAIHHSKPIRQERPMDAAYLAPDIVRADLGAFSQMPAVFDEHDQLVAYALVPICGDVANVSRILGHAAALDHGVMYLLLSEIIGALVLKRREKGTPRVLMYDTYFGGGPGLRTFKKHFGFRPHRVRWAWEE